MRYNISIETIVLAGVLTFMPVHAPQVCDSTTEYKIEYAKIQEEREKQAKIEYKSKSSSGKSTIIKLIPNGNVGYNCVLYVKSKSKTPLPQGLYSLQQKKSKLNREGKVERGRVGLTAEGPVGHVVLIESVNENGTVTISESNYVRGKISWRIIPKSKIIGVY